MYGAKIVILYAESTFFHHFRKKVSACPTIWDKQPLNLPTNSFLNISNYESKRPTYIIHLD